MKLITRYLYRELLVPFLLGLALFTGIFLLQRLFELTELVVSRGLPVTRVILLVLAGLPQTLFLTVPMAAILAVLMAYGRLAADNELTALRVAGYPLLSLVLPVLIASLVVTGGLLALRQYGLPALSQYRKQSFKEISFPSPSRLMAADSYLELGPYTIFARKVDGGDMEGIYLEDRSGGRLVVVYAESGRWLEGDNNNYQLLLNSGTMHQKLKGGDYRVLEFERQTIGINPGSLAGGISGTGELTAPITALYERMARAYSKFEARKDKSATGKTTEKLLKKYRREALNFHRALAFPAATFFLVVIAAPLGMLAQKSGKSIGLALTLGIIFLYYLFITLMEPLAMRGWVTAGVGLWAPNFIFGGIGAFMLFMLWRRGQKF